MSGSPVSGSATQYPGAPRSPCPIRPARSPTGSSSRSTRSFTTWDPDVSTRTIPATSSMPIRVGPVGDMVIDESFLHPSPPAPRCAPDTVTSPQAAPGLANAGWAPFSKCAGVHGPAHTTWHRLTPKVTVNRIVNTAADLASPCTTTVNNVVQESLRCAISDANAEQLGRYHLLQHPVQCARLHEQRLCHLANQPVACPHGEHDHHRRLLATQLRKPTRRALPADNAAVHVGLQRHRRRAALPPASISPAALIQCAGSPS